MKLVETEEEKILADSARTLLDRSAPIGKLRQMRDAGRTNEPELWQEMAAAGWSGILVPEEFGGSAMGHAAANVLAREMGRNLTVSPFISTAVIAAGVLRSVETDVARDRLSQLAAGTLTYALAIDEASKFDPSNVQMTAEPRGNGYVLSGKKVFVADGCNATRILLLARSPDGLCLFDLEKSLPGFTQQEVQMIDSRDLAEFSLENVEVSGETLVGHPGEGLTLLSPALQAGQAALAAEATGLAEAAFGMTSGYLKERKQFGVPIGSFQALQHRAAHLWCEIEVTSSAVLNAGRMLDQDPQNAALAVSVAKARATETAQRVVQEGVQMHGGIGMTDAFDMGFYMKRARVSAEWLGDYGYHAAIVANLRGF